MLLAHYTDVNIRGQIDSTALHWASGNNNREEVTELLLSTGADPYLKDRYGDYPLHRAAGFNTAQVLNREGRVTHYKHNSLHL